MLSVMNKIVFFIIPLFMYCLLRFLADLPVTGREADESYQAFAILNGGDFWNFRQTASSFAITYLRIPFIAVFGLNDFGVRLPSILFGGISLALLTLWIKSVKKHFPYSQKAHLWYLLILLVIFGFVFSPGVIQSNLFNLADTVALLLTLLGLILFHKSPRLGIIFLLLAPFVSLFSMPLSIFILIYYGKISNVGYKIYYLIPFLLISCIVSLLLNPGYFKSIAERSLVAELKPSSYTWQIDRRLAYDQVEGSPLDTPEFNFNRIIHNKFTYGLNKFFYIVAGSIDLDKISSPFQKPVSQNNFNINDQKLPDVFFFEIPLIFIGLLKLLQEKSRLIFIGVAGLLPIILFDGFKSFIYFSPFILICIAVGLITLAETLLHKFRIMGLIILLVLYLTAEISFQDLLRFHPEEWMAESDFRQFQIWNSAKDSGKKYSEIHVTDRLGDPKPYFLYYNKLTPFPADQELKKYIFSSFKYLESDRKPNQLWVGLAGEFVGKFNQYKGVEQISDGKILAKFPGVKQSDQFLGDELWIVETVFDHDKK